MRFVQVRSDDDIDDARFILQQQEHKTFSGAWSLTTDYETGSPH